LPRTGPFDVHATRYDRWFDENRALYLAELEAIRSVMPDHSRPVEVGVGTGRFAGPLGISLGVEPSAAMAEIARSRGIDVVDGVAESLPFGDATFDLLLMVTTICFLDDIRLALREAHRVLSDGGHIVLGFLDRETEPGRAYEARKRDSDFYSAARFRSSAEVLSALRLAGFGDLKCAQTIMSSRSGSSQEQLPVAEGHGTGLFAAVRGRRVTNVAEGART
jgi:SAM-dependent methyltransferase